MLKTISTTELRAEIKRVLNEVGYGQSQYLVEKFGEPTAAIINLEDFRLLQAVKERQAAGSLRETLAGIRQRGEDLAPGELDKLIGPNSWLSIPTFCDIIVIRKSMLITELTSQPTTPPRSQFFPSTITTNFAPPTISLDLHRKSRFESKKKLPWYTGHEACAPHSSPFTSHSRCPPRRCQVRSARPSPHR
jgi:prevent-host-death family protein